MGRQIAQRRALLQRLLQSGAASTPKNLGLLLEAHGYPTTRRTVLHDLRALRRRDLRTLRRHDQQRGRLVELWRAFSEPLRACRAGENLPERLAASPSHKVEHPKYCLPTRDWS